MNRIASVGLCVFLFVSGFSCGKKDSDPAAPQAVASSTPSEAEPTYKGRALSDWVRQLKDADPDTQCAAIVALSKMSGDDRSIKALAGMLDDPIHKVRFAAFDAVWAFLSDEQKLNFMISVAKDASADEPKDLVRDSFVGCAENLKSKGASLLPYIEPIRVELSKRLEASGDTIETPEISILKRVIGYLKSPAT